MQYNSLDMRYNPSDMQYNSVDMQYNPSDMQYNSVDMQYKRLFMKLCLQKRKTKETVHETVSAKKKN